MRSFTIRIAIAAGRGRWRGSKPRSTGCIRGARFWRRRERLRRTTGCARRNRRFWISGAHFSLLTGMHVKTGAGVGCPQVEAWRRSRRPSAVGEERRRRPDRLALAELVDPAREGFVGATLEVQELDTHADAGLDDANDRQATDGLTLASQSEASASLNG